MTYPRDRSRLGWTPADSRWHATMLAGEGVLRMLQRLCGPIPRPVRVGDEVVAAVPEHGGDRPGLQWRRIPRLAAACVLAEQTGEATHRLVGYGSAASATAAAATL